ncbi:hypothetical protein M426DRAFT_317462 [Hypoxylon sp. CI-4A]|nr:hypothetical protein M426DRAFT_317462 [Hypoxylon sp. CI-4A]
MSIELRDVSNLNTRQLTKLLARRPEYGIAIPSRRWLISQQDKIKQLPKELRRTPNPVLRLAMKFFDKIDVDIVDSRAVLCKPHRKLNAFIIRRLFMSVACEVTVFTDILRSWKGRKDHPEISAFIGRIDAIAALWTPPELYDQCYGTPPFKNHMVFIQTGCEACILGALGANARALADLRTALVDRHERHVRSDGRRVSKPKLTRFVEEWIDHLSADRAATCREWSDRILSELRTTRPQLLTWQDQRRKEHRSSGRPVYTELKGTRSGGHEFSDVPSEFRHKRRTKNGIPVAVTDPESAKEQRKAAMNKMTEQGEPSVWRPDSMWNFSQIRIPQGPAFDPTNEQPDVPIVPSFDVIDMDDEFNPYDYDEKDGKPDLERDMQADAQSRENVTNWYSTRLAQIGTNMTADKAKSALTLIHPALKSTVAFSHMSAAPSPLQFKKATENEKAAQSSVWTNASVYSYDNGNDTNGGSSSIPPVPRVPSRFQETSSSAKHPKRSSTMSSSIYSQDDPPPSRHPMRSNVPPKSPSAEVHRKYQLKAGHDKPTTDRTQNPPRQNGGVMKDFARDRNPFTRGNKQRGGDNTPTSPKSKTASRSGSGSTTPTQSSVNTRHSVPSTPELTRSTSRSSRYSSEDDDDDDDLPTPTASMPADPNVWWRNSWPVPTDEGVGEGGKSSAADWARVEKNFEELTPWGMFTRGSGGS